MRVQMSGPQNSGKFIIRNGWIVDGSGASGFRGELLIDHGKIKQVSERVDAQDAAVIDADGGVVCPGFIDTHSHSGPHLYSDPLMEPKLRQGITTEILGQDGISLAPVSAGDVPVWKAQVEEIEGLGSEIDWSACGSVADYLARIKRLGVSANYGYLVPHGNLRMAVMGMENRFADSDRLKAMCALLEREMQSGALGLSAGLIYAPCCFADTKELIELCKVVARRDGVFAVHQRSEANEILSSLEELLQIARESGVRLHISHFKICGKQNWEKAGRIFALLDAAKRDGIRVTFDLYPYTAGCTALSVLLPPWAHEGGREQLCKQLRNMPTRRKMKEEILKSNSQWDNFVEFAGLDGIVITKSQNAELIGKNLLEMGKMQGKDPLDAVFDLLLSESGAAIIDFYGSEDVLESMIQRPEQNFCTDGEVCAHPHPRLYGSFPRALSRFVREKQLLTLEQAIHKMTGLPAETFSLAGRGLIEEGNCADLLIFDQSEIQERATYLNPALYSSGIHLVMVNGMPVLLNGENLKPPAGEILCR